MLYYPIKMLEYELIILQFIKTTIYVIVHLILYRK